MGSASARSGASACSVLSSPIACLSTKPAPSRRTSRVSRQPRTECPASPPSLPAKHLPGASSDPSLARAVASGSGAAARHRIPARARSRRTSAPWPRCLTTRLDGGQPWPGERVAGRGGPERCRAHDRGVAGKQVSLRESRTRCPRPERVRALRGAKLSDSQSRHHDSVGDSVAQLAIWIFFLTSELCQMQKDLEFMYGDTLWLWRMMAFLRCCLGQQEWNTGDRSQGHRSGLVCSPAELSVALRGDLGELLVSRDRRWHRADFCGPDPRDRPAGRARRSGRSGRSVGSTSRPAASALPRPPDGVGGVMWSNARTYRWLRTPRSRRCSRAATRS